MSLFDYVYRLKPKAGDTSPVNEVGGAQALTGVSAPTLVDLGGSTYAWRTTGNPLMATITGKTIGATGGSTAGGVTVVLRLAIATDPGASDHRLFTLGSTTSAFEPGLQLRRSTAAGYVAGAFRDSGVTTILTPDIIGVGTTMHTYVLRLACDGATGVPEEVAVWWSGGAALTTPDSVYSASLGVNYLLQYLHLDPGGGQLDIRDVLVYHDTKTAAECVQLLDLDAALAGPSFVKPLILQAGRITEFPAGSFIDPSVLSSDKSIKFGTASLSFTSTNEASTTVTIPEIAATSVVFVWVSTSLASTDFTIADHKYLALLLSLTAGDVVAGSGCTLYGRSLEKIEGQLNVNYAWI